jgi:hypothetical protein
MPSVVHFQSGIGWTVSAKLYKEVTFNCAYHFNNRLWILINFAQVLYKNLFGWLDRHMQMTYRILKKEP